MVEKYIPAYETQLRDMASHKKMIGQTIITEKKFLKLMENVVSYISKLTDFRQIDKILRMFFSNLTTLDRTISVYEFTDPWNELINTPWLGMRDSPSLQIKNRFATATLWAEGAGLVHWTNTFDLHRPHRPI